MKRTPSGWLVLDRAAGDLEGQVHRAIRERILAGQMAPGHALPSTRALAAGLGLARSTVVQAYERLRTEGFLQAAPGAATRVAALPPPPRLPASRSPASHSPASWPPAPPPAPPAPALPAPALPAPTGLFASGVPDLARFPHAAWARCLGARARALRVHDLGYAAPSGIAPLCRAILAHVALTRGVSATAEQVLVLPSTGAAIDLIARLHLRAGDAAWIEEPGYPSAQTLLRAAGATLVPVPCDEAGIDIAAMGAAIPPPRLIYVSPSHQYPTGAAMSLARRLAVLAAAQAHGALVLEDDYDSEFQYASRPVAALQGIDRAGAVVYLGTFSKVLAPGLRVAYAILPAPLVPAAAAALRLRGALVPVHVQAALADFLDEGYLRAHVRRMGALYAARMAATVQALRRHCGHRLRIADGAGGLQLAAWFHDERAEDRAAAAGLNAAGFAVRALSEFHLGAPKPGLLFGIAQVEPAAADGLARRIRAILDALPAPR